MLNWSYARVPLLAEHSSYANTMNRGVSLLGTAGDVLLEHGLMVRVA